MDKSAIELYKNFFKNIDNKLIKEGHGFYQYNISKTAG